jgi:transposase-like protein
MSVHHPYCNSQNPSSESRSLIVCTGYFLRKSDQTRHQRYRCKPCERTFSSASLEPCYRQKKRHLNSQVFEYIVSGVSQRRLARTLRTNRKTIVRKFLFLTLYAQALFEEDREKYPEATEIEFDDLETFEHSKLKPLSVTMAVETGSRRILGFRVASMPAKGLLVQRSLKKYGPRKDERKQMRNKLFTEIKPYIAKNALIKSDENPHYPGSVRHHFPGSIHQVFKGRRGCVVGQGELKAGGFDPIFSLNHSFAMYRANINRLFRRTWNTTKKKERLAIAVLLYSLYHNLVLIHSPSR